MKPHLISFKLCPFAQRSIILLKHGAIAFDLTSIDPGNPPPEFTALSPLGRVPLLQVNHQVLFESLAIAEYLNECYALQLHDTDLILKAQHRAWMSYSSELLGTLFALTIAKTQADYQQQYQDLTQQLLKVAPLVQGPYFNGQRLQLVDIAFAPLLLRLACLEQRYGLTVMADHPTLQRWRDQLLALPAVQASVVEDFAELYGQFIDSKGAYLALRPQDSRPSAPPIGIS